MIDGRRAASGGLKVSTFNSRARRRDLNLSSFYRREFLAMASPAACRRKKSGRNAPVRSSPAVIGCTRTRYVPARDRSMRRIYWGSGILAALVAALLIIRLDRCWWIMAISEWLEAHFQSSPPASTCLRRAKARRPPHVASIPSAADAAAP